MSEFPIHGQVAAGFESVREVFERNFTADIEVGASFSAVMEGETVVDLWGGYQDRGHTRPWQQDTLINVYSTTKGVGSLAAAIAVADGHFAYGQAVTDIWPEFGQHGKDVLNIGQLLSHQGGVCGVSTKLTVEDLYDWDRMVGLLAAQQPLWEPGKGAGYHAVTWGYLPGELIRRTAGMTLGRLFHERVAGPLDADFFVGLPASELGRCADMIGPNHARELPGDRDRPTQPPPKMPPLYPIALLNPSIRPFKDASSPAWRQAEIAAANGQANARGIARVYGAMAQGGVLNGVRVVDEEALAQARVQEVGDEVDLVLGRSLRRARGFILNNDGIYGANPDAFGHSGAGGSIGFADPARGLGVGYAMNQMQNNMDNDTRGGRLIKALYQCL